MGLSPNTGISGAGLNDGTGFGGAGLEGSSEASTIFYDHDFSAVANGVALTSTTPDVNDGGNSYQQEGSATILTADGTGMTSPDGTASRGYIDLGQAGNWIGKIQGVAIATGFTQFGRLDATALGSGTITGVLAWLEPQNSRWRIMSYDANVGTEEDTTPVSGNQTNPWYISFIGAECRVYDNTKSEVLQFLTMSAADQAETALRYALRRTLDYYTRVTVWNEDSIDNVD